MIDRILKILAYVMLLIFVISVCALDSESRIPLYVLCLTGGWLTLYCYSNNWFRDRFENGNKRKQIKGR